MTTRMSPWKLGSMVGINGLLHYTYKWFVYWGELAHLDPITFDPSTMSRDIQVRRF